MKTIRALRTQLGFSPHEINSQIKYFAENVKIDFNVYLSTKRMNLQRGFVWDVRQKRELIWSILMNRNIPRMAMMVDNKEVYQVIDGKQRLSTMIDFYNGKFHLEVNGKYYLFGDLPKDYQNVISGYQFAYYIVHEINEGDFKDSDKIDWFTYINFAGTAQDESHFLKLKQ